MQCPNDSTELQMTSRDGIEIDYCPKCRGVWLDRGELDKLIERSSGSYGPPAHTQEHYGRQQDSAQSVHRRDDDDDDDDHYGRHDNRTHQGYDNHGQPHKKKKEGFLGDLFDF